MDEGESSGITFNQFIIELFQSSVVDEVSHGGVLGFPLSLKTHDVF